MKALTNSELRIHGRKDERMSTDGLAGAVRPLLLYPSSNAVELTPQLVTQLDGPVTLIVPDSSWRQAQRFVRREPALLGIPHVKLPEGAPSEYRLRQQPNDTSLCTLEAIARAIGLLESPEGQARLETVLNVMVERVLWSRGKLPADQCTASDIPPGAFLHVNGPERVKRQQIKGESASAKRARESV